MTDKHRIHIVGLYKCGTSWLLRMLAAHPEVIAWREFDPLRSVYAPDHRLQHLPRTAADYFFRKAADDRWMARRERDVLRSASDVFTASFLGHGWIPLMGSEHQQSAANLTALKTDRIVDKLLSLGNLKLRPESASKLDPARQNGIHGVQSFDRQTLLELMKISRDTSTSEQLPEHFYQSLQELAEPDCTTVTKAADQLMQYQRLRGISRNAKCIAIIRDGRDAMISARHYEALMRSADAPWKVSPTHGLRRLLGWGVRAAKLAEHARRGEILVVRYEDLLEDFEQTTTALLATLNLSHSDRIVDEIKKLSAFETMSDGRAQGEAAQHVVRRGVSGEWKTTLNDTTAALAWKLVGGELRSFGYREDGSFESSNLLIGHSPV